jgi:hypothetical protein
MLYDAHNRPIERTGMHGMQADAFQQPAGAIVSVEITRALQNKIRNDTKFRERIELAQKIVHKKFKKKGKLLHLAMLKREDMERGVEDSLIKNQAFGEKVLRERAKNENLTETDKGYEQAKMVA